MIKSMFFVNLLLYALLNIAGLLNSNIPILYEQLVFNKTNENRENCRKINITDPSSGQYSHFQLVLYASQKHTFMNYPVSISVKQQWHRNRYYNSPFWRIIQIFNWNLLCATKKIKKINTYEIWFSYIHKFTTFRW